MTGRNRRNGGAQTRPTRPPMRRPPPTAPRRRRVPPPPARRRNNNAPRARTRGPRRRAPRRRRPNPQFSRQFAQFGEAVTNPFAEAAIGATMPDQWNPPSIAATDRLTLSLSPAFYASVNTASDTLPERGRITQISGFVLSALPRCISLGILTSVAGGDGGGQSLPIFGMFPMSEKFGVLTSNPLKNLYSLAVSVIGEATFVTGDNVTSVIHGLLGLSLVAQADLTTRLAQRDAVMYNVLHYRGFSARYLAFAVVDGNFSIALARVYYDAHIWGFLPPKEIVEFLYRCGRLRIFRAMLPRCKIPHPTDVCPIPSTPTLSCAGTDTPPTPSRSLAVHLRNVAAAVAIAESECSDAKDDEPCAGDDRPDCPARSPRPRKCDLPDRPPRPPCLPPRPPAPPRDPCRDSPPHHGPPRVRGLHVGYYHVDPRCHLPNCRQKHDAVQCHLPACCHHGPPSSPSPPPYAAPCAVHHPRPCPTDCPTDPHSLAFAKRTSSVSKPDSYRQAAARDSYRQVAARVSTTYTVSNHSQAGGRRPCPIVIPPICMPRQSLVLRKRLRAALAVVSRRGRIRDAIHGPDLRFLQRGLDGKLRHPMDFNIDGDPAAPTAGSYIVVTPAACNVVPFHKTNTLQQLSSGGRLVGLGLKVWSDEAPIVTGGSAFGGWYNIRAFVDNFNQFRAAPTRTSAANIQDDLTYRRGYKAIDGTTTRYSPCQSVVQSAFTPIIYDNEEGYDPGLIPTGSFGAAADACGPADLIPAVVWKYNTTSTQDLYTLRLQLVAHVQALPNNVNPFITSEHPPDPSYHAMTALLDNKEVYPVAVKGSSFTSFMSKIGRAFAAASPHLSRFGRILGVAGAAVGQAGQILLGSGGDK